MSSALSGIKGMRGLLGQLHAYPRFVAEQAALLLRKNTRTLISSSGKIPGLVQVTPPHGGKGGKVRGSAARKQGEIAVARDIRRVYATPGRIFAELKKHHTAGDYAAARAFYAFAKKKKWAEANAILSRMSSLPDWARQGLRAFDDGAEHVRRRNPNTGKVGSKTPSFLVANPKWVTAYIRVKQKNVGMLAAAIPAAYTGQYGPLGGIPGWVSRHQKSWAGARIAERRVRHGMLVVINVSAGALNNDLQVRFTYVADYRLKAMEREAPYAIRAAAKSAGLLT